MTGKWQKSTNRRPARAKSCRVGDGTSVPVEEIEEAEEPSSHASSFIDSGIGASGGSLANLALAKDLWRSLIEVDTRRSKRGANWPQMFDLIH